VKKIRPAQRPGAITIGQTRDASAIAAMVTAAGAKPEDHQQSGGCVLLAYSGETPVGIVAIATSVDTGRLTLLWVAETMRRRGIGAALVAAARKAAHTRGARTLLASCPLEVGGYLRKLGFDHAVAPKPTWILDLSREGIIER
jgi:GNAT superfamily N-acetyltransferase